MKKYIEYVKKFQEGNKYGIYFIDNNLGNGTYKDKKDIKTLTQNNIEHILDFVYSEKKIYKGLGLKTILEKSYAWNRKLILNASTKDNEIEGIDYEVIKDFDDGFRFVKLISEACYKREGALMSHCVGSYFGRDVEIFSLRDKNNLPHCTIEENNQVKGKGNQTVDNKYFGYCIEFLEEMGFSIGEEEMTNIGYYKLNKIDDNLSCNKMFKDYVSAKDLNLIKDKEGNQYNGFGLLKVKGLFEFDLDLNLKFNFDIEKIKLYFKNKLAGGYKSKLDGLDNNKLDGLDNNKLVGGYEKQLVGGEYSQLAGGNNSQLIGLNNNQLAGGDFSKLDGGYNNQLAGGYESQLIGGNCSKLAGGNNSQLAGGEYSQLSGGHKSQLVGGDKSQLAGGDYNELAGLDKSQLAGGEYSKLSGCNFSQLAGGDHSQLAGGDYSQITGGYESRLAGGNNSQLTGGDFSQLILKGNNSIAVGGNGSKGKGVMGSYIILCENNKQGNIGTVKVLKIDGKKYKENTFYKLENGNFILDNN